MKALFASAIIAGTTFVLAGSGTAMTLAPQDSPSLVQTVKDRTCNAPSRSGRCQWYGMPGVHKGPKWLRQSQPGKHHYHHRKRVKEPVVHKTTAPAPTPAPAPAPATPAPTPQTTTPPSTTPPVQQTP